MPLVLRPITPDDAPEAGRIVHAAFKAIADEHNYPPDFPDPDVATGAIKHIIALSGSYGILAERDGRVVGSNFVDERAAVVGLGPITVDPSAQNAGVGKALMSHMIERERARGAAGLRLLQSAYHRRSLCLYTKLGFVVREPIANLQGSALGLTIPGCTVRPAGDADLAACNRLCHDVHGHDRGGELREAIDARTAALVERAGRITGYTTGIAFFGHAVGETNDDLKALIGAASAFGGPGFLLPSRNAELFRWCLDQGSGWCSRSP